MRVRRTVVAVAVTCAAMCSTAHAEVVELKALEKRALERHFSLRAADARTRAANAGVDEARAGYKPHFGVNIDSNLAPGRKIIQIPSFDKDTGLPNRDANGNVEKGSYVQGVNALSKSNAASAFYPQWRTTTNLVIGTNIYDFGRTNAAVNASLARLESANADHEVTRAQVLSSVRQAYLNWLSAHELHRLSESGTSDSQQRTQRVTALIQEGARPRGDLAPVESDRLLSELELERSTGDLEGARMLLERTVGEPLPANAEPQLAVLDVVPARDNPAAIDPSLRMLAAQRAATEATARLQRKAQSPVISASAGAGFGTQLDVASGHANVLPSYIVGLGVSIPIWDGGATSASAAATQARADELRLRVESEEIDRRQDRIKARLDAEHAQNRENTALQLVEVCKTRVADTEAGYELGAMQFEQVQQARGMLRRAETEVVLAKVARAEAVLRFAP